MKRLSDYKNEDAIDLWAKLIGSISAIMSDEKVKRIFGDSEKTIAQKASAVLSDHKKEVQDILLAIDDTPIDGLNLVIRLIDLLKELEENEELKVFFQL